MLSAITVRDQDVMTAMATTLLTEEVEVAAVMVVMTDQEVMTTKETVKKAATVDITLTTITMAEVITMAEMAGAITIVAEVGAAETDISLANATMIETMAAIDMGAMTNVAETKATEVTTITTIITVGEATIIGAVHRLINLAIRTTIVNRWEFSQKGAE